MKKNLFLSFVIVFFIASSIAIKNSFAQDMSSNYRQGIELAAEGKFQEAADWFKDNLKNNKTDSTSESSLVVIQDLNEGKITDTYAKSFFIGLNLLQNGKINDGLKGLESTIASNSSYPRPYNVMAMIYASQGDNAKAINYFKKAIEVNPQYAQAYFNLAAVYQSAAQPQEALKYYEKAVALDAKLSEAIINTADIYASLENYSQAIKNYQSALELDQNNPRIYYNLALVYFMSDQFTKFKENLLKAKELYQKAGDIQGLENVAVYMDKIKEIEKKIKH